MTITAEKLQELSDKVLFFAMRSEYKDIVTKATKQFTSTRNEESIYGSEFGLNQWLIHDYKWDDDDTSFAQLYKETTALSDEEKQMIEMITKSRLSIFQIQKSVKVPYIKDILTRKDYSIINPESLELFDETSIHLFRAYPFQGSWIIISEGGVLDKTFLESLYKALMDKYVEHTKIHGPSDLETFVYGNPLLVYKLVEIVEDIESLEMGNDEYYVVYQSAYVYLDKNQIVKMMENLPNIELAIEEDGVFVYRLFEGQQLAEVILTENKMEVECNTELERKRTKELLQNHFGDLITHVKDEVLDMDQLLEGE